jgi:hypothetical protein
MTALEIIVWNLVSVFFVALTAAGFVLLVALQG